MKTKFKCFLCNSDEIDLSLDYIGEDKYKFISINTKNINIHDGVALSIEDALKLAFSIIRLCIKE